MTALSAHLEFCPHCQDLTNLCVRGYSLLFASIMDDYDENLSLHDLTTLRNMAKEEAQILLKHFPAENQQNVENPNPPQPARVAAGILEL